MFIRYTQPASASAARRAPAGEVRSKRIFAEYGRIIPHRCAIDDRSRREYMEGKDLRKAGLKVTLPRLKILEILEGSTTRHLSAEDIYRRLIESNEDIGLATVYRVLTQFEAAGLVTRHHFEDGMAVFELNAGRRITTISCVWTAAASKSSSIRKSKSARKRSPRSLGFAIGEHSLILYGRCERVDCPRRKAKARNEQRRLSPCGCASRPLPARRHRSRAGSISSACDRALWR